jgi:prepilin-type N-terminal cleavage/methylation domain-containing protein/prepilin-type processing-associated H-X9-DG protein
MRVQVRRTRGFTLIELLLVIAIVGLLAAILFPVFAQARAKAHQAQCLSHLRQIGMAFKLYLQDYDEHFPADADLSDEIHQASDARGVWFQQIQPYLRSLDVLHCPSDNVSDALRATSPCAAEARNAPGLPALSYGANLFLPLAWNNPPWSQFRTVAGIPRPSQTVLVGDCTEPLLYQPCPETDRKGVRWSHIAYANGPPACNRTGSSHWGPHGGHSGAGHERHIAGSNLGYLDGHVQYLAADRFVCHVRLPIYWQRPIIWPDSKRPEEEPGALPSGGP